MALRVRSTGLALLLALVACPADVPVPDGTPSRPAGAGGTLRVLMAADVDSLDPHRAARPSSWFFARALHRGLLGYPNEPFPDGASPAPDLAEAMPTVTAGARRYRFLLREGVAFGAPSDRPIAARDVVASLQRVIREDKGMARSLSVIRGAAAYRRGRAGRVTGLRARGPRTIVIRLRHPASDLPWLLAHPQLAVLPADIGAPGAVPPVDIAGAGPYRLVRYDPEQRIVLERNPGWSADPLRRAFVDRIDAQIGIGRDEAARAIARGDGDLLLEAGPPDLGPLDVPRSARIVSVVGGCVRALFLDTRRGPLRRLQARRAIALAIRREALPGVPESDPPALRLLAPAVFGHRASPVLGESLRLARAALARAGGGFSSTLVVGSGRRDRAEVRAIATSLARAGIQITRRHVAPAILHRTYAAGSAPMGIVTWCADHPGLSGRNVMDALLSPGGAVAYSHLDGGPVRRAIEDAARASSERAPGLWARADRLAVASAALIPLSWPAEQVVISARVAGFGAAPMFPRGDPTNLTVEP